MPSSKTGTAPLLHWGVATLALAGQRESGDLHLVRPLEGGACVAVVDGLGHGEEAAAAAKAAVATVERFAHEPPLSVVQRCHEALIGSRGVVMSIATFDAAHGTMTWLGVGNVEGVLQHADWSERSAAGAGRDTPFGSGRRSSRPGSGGPRICRRAPANCRKAGGRR